ncbi:MAG: PilZ domain-containing protein [Deltaproteobacteria bacterium]|nr:PilZ domain-containing protein [Deltaproteobacteria bacterium]MBW2193631.1 PilZ domain-containing protein [Deltaproteobacteria bacterium]
MNTGSNKRKSPRFDARWPVTISTDKGEIAGETINISLEGIAICCEKPLHLNKIFRMSMVSLDNQIIQIAGKIVWSDLYGMDDKETAIGMGICFVEVSDKDRHIINHVISSYAGE